MKHENFGNSFYLFPSGKFEIYWSPKINDIFDIKKESIMLRNIALDSSNIYLIMAIFLLFYNASHMKLNNNKIFKDIIEYVFSKKFKLFNKKFPDIFSGTFSDYTTNDIIEHAKSFENKCAKEFINLFYKKGNLPKAINSGNEIMIDCNEYYLINVNSIDEQSLKEKLY